MALLLLFLALLPTACLLLAALIRGMEPRSSYDATRAPPPRKDRAP